MAKKVIDFLKSLAAKAGANVEDEALKTAFAAVNADAELPDELVTAIDNGLLSVANAKNNHPEIKKHYFAQAYNGLDKELDDFIAEEKLPEEMVAAIKAEQSSTKRAKLVALKIKDLQQQKANAGKSDKEELNNQIAVLNKELRDIKDKEQAIHADYKKQIQEVKMGHVLGGLLGSYKTVFDELDPATKEITLKSIINKNLGIKKAQLSLDESGNLALIGADGANVFGDDHRPLTPKAFLDSIMANEKILKVTENSNNNSSNGSNGQHFNGQQRQQFNNGNQNQNGNAGKKNTVLASLLQESQTALDLAGKSPVL
jgi:hypothetical protein